MADGMEKILELARKLKALADRGIDGEKDTANAMLRKFMKQHSITVEMINGIEISEHEFRVEEARVKFFGQIVASVLGHCKVYTLKRDNAKKKHFFIDCTASEAIEIQAKFDFFWVRWMEEQDVFYQAFIQKNRIYSKPKEKKGDEPESPPLTAEERAKLYRMAQMMEGMDRHHFVKQIGN